MAEGSIATTEVVDTVRGKTPTSLYVHVPFCASRCFYCDFTTYVAPPAVVETYVSALLSELSMIGKEAGAPLKTVFFGGGTPTFLSSEQLAQVLQVLNEQFQLDADAEVTVEANPGTVDESKLAVLKAGGVNRLSFGAQSMNERLLMAIGRIHDAKAVRDSVALAKQAGFAHVNVDLMFGLPEQSLQDVEESIDDIMGLGIDHVSAYWLKVEQGTPFAKWQAEGVLPLPGEDAEGDMYDLVRASLLAHGYRHYEVSNFAQAGCEAKHNLVYWRNEPYFAAGAGAHGYVRGGRYENVKSLQTYSHLLAQGKRPIADRHDVSTDEAVEDTLMLGLRLRDGVSDRNFHERHGAHIVEAFPGVVEPLVAAQLLEWQGDYIRLTDRAWPIANVVFERFVGSRTDG